MISNLLSDIKRAGACVCVLAASAAFCSDAIAAEVVNLGELQNGVATEYPGNFVAVEATFTVPADGAVRVSCTGDFLNVYGDAEHTVDIENEFSYVNGIATRTYQCTEGEVLYLYNSFVMSGGKVTVTGGNMDVALADTNPSANPDSPWYYGGSYSISGDYSVLFIFNQLVDVQGGRMSANGTTVDLVAEAQGSNVEVEVSPLMMEMYKTGVIKKGDTVKVELYGVTEKGNADNKLGDDGVASVEFVMDAQPIELVSTVNTPASGGEKMLSYYVPGDSRALVKLIFNGSVEGGDKAPRACLQYGDIDNIEAGMYIEYLDGTVEGDTVVFDLSGKLRRPVDMLPALTTPMDYIYFAVSGVRGTDGQYAYTGYRSNPYNFSYNYMLEVLQYNVVADFTPSEKKGLEEGQEMEIFIMDGDKLTFDGVKFSYTASGAPAEAVVQKENLDIAFENGTDLVIVLNVPALPGIDDGSEVTVTLDNMVCSDGLDHQANVTAVYKDFKTTGVDAVIGYDDNVMDVYSTQGVLVRKGVKASEISQLPAGLYIAGGRKIIVR